MKNKKGTLRVIIDTSFLLPTLGINTGTRILKGLQKLKKVGAEIFISRFSILEGLWVAIRMIKRGSFDESSFSHGLKSLLMGHRYKLVEETPEIFETALDLYQMGHPDMIDNLLYATSLVYHLAFLTTDKELKAFIKENNLTDTILTPEDI